MKVHRFRRENRVVEMLICARRSMQTRTIRSVIEAARAVKREIL